MIRNRAEAEAHQIKHGFTLAPLTGPGAKGSEVCAPVEQSTLRLRRSRMNKTEHEYSLILEAKKGRGEIAEYRFEGITLRWGKDPETGRCMTYTPDFVVWKDAGPDMELHEVKGGHMRSRDLVRFKGCRAEWWRYHFELHQKREGQWYRIY